MSVQLARKRFTTAEYHQMIAAGIFDEDERLELIEGEIVEMSPIGPRHIATVNRLNRVLILQLADIAIISVQNPVELNQYSEPEPDLTLLKWRDDFYAVSLPTVTDVLVAIEVADATVEKDRGAKIPSYARAARRLPNHPAATIERRRYSWLTASRTKKALAPGNFREPKPLSVEIKFIFGEA